MPARVRLTPGQEEHLIRALARAAEWLGRILHWQWWEQALAGLGAGLLGAGGMVARELIGRRRL